MRGRGRRFLKARRAGVSACAMTGARALVTRRVSSDREQPPSLGASGIHRGAKPVLQCLKFGRKAFRQDGRTATETRVRSPSEESAFQAEPERWNGIRTRVMMIIIHLLYH
jgi:hypothetical protein